MQWNDVVTLIMALVALGTAVLAWRKFPQDKESADVDIAAKYESMVARAADREVQSQMRADQKEKDFQDRLNKCLSRITQLENRLIELEADIVALQRENNKLAEWARRLSSQVVALGGTPIPKPDTGNLTPRPS